MKIILMTTATAMVAMFGSGDVLAGERKSCYEQFQDTMGWLTAHHCPQYQDTEGCEADGLKGAADAMQKCVTGLLVIRPRPQDQITEQAAPAGR